MTKHHHLKFPSKGVPTELSPSALQESNIVRSFLSRANIFECDLYEREVRFVYDQTEISPQFSISNITVTFRQGQFT